MDFRGIVIYKTYNFLNYVVVFTYTTLCMYYLDNVVANSGLEKAEKTLDVLNCSSNFRIFLNGYVFRLIEFSFVYRKRAV